MSVLAIKSNKLVVAAHDRMPVVPNTDDYGAWLDPATALKALLRPGDSPSVHPILLHQQPNR